MMSPEMAGDLLIYSLPLLTTGATVALTATGLYLGSKLHNKRLAQAVMLLDQIVIDVVKELNQTVVADLKKARADGKLTPDEAAQIKSKAIELIVSRLGLDLIRVIERSLGSVLLIIATKIEATVFDCKRSAKHQPSKSLKLAVAR
ncbi:MAG TPA: hypothetical protein VF531_12235 [Bacillota bacterium]